MAGKVNILPWREKWLKRKRWQFFALISLCLIIVMVGGYFLSLPYRQKLADVQLQLQKVEAQHKQLSQESKSMRSAILYKQKQLDYIGLIQVILQHQFQLLKALQYFEKNTPTSVALTQLLYQEGEFSLKGVALAKSAIFNWQNSLQQAAWIKEWQVKNIQNFSAADSHYQAFSVDFRMQGEG